jgi:hypothetical protein
MHERRYRNNKKICLLLNGRYDKMTIGWRIIAIVMLRPTEFLLKQLATVTVAQ